MYLAKEEEKLHIATIVMTLSTYQDNGSRPTGRSVHRD